MADVLRHSPRLRRKMPALGPPGSGFLRRDNPLLRAQRRRQVGRRGQARVPGLPVGRGMPGGSAGAARLSESRLRRPARSRRRPRHVRHGLPPQPGRELRIRTRDARLLRSPSRAGVRGHQGPRSAWRRPGRQRGGGRPQAAGRHTSDAGGLARAASDLATDVSAATATRGWRAAARGRRVPADARLSAVGGARASMGPRTGAAWRSACR